MNDEGRRARQREAQRRYRERQAALGLKPKSRTDQQKAQQRDAMRARRAAAQDAGISLPGDGWASRNKDRHRENVARWRSENPEKSTEMGRRHQASRRSTPWGAINNRLWAVMHGAVRGNSSRQSKYTQALGYLWSDLRTHIEAQFQPGMSWDNWGSVWELDHRVPVSSFRYVSLDDPIFREAWRLSNLRPLSTAENAAKGHKPQVNPA